MRAATSNKHFLSYQPHIDGLRAIAVLSVVFFHLSPRLLPGGFLGVDVFFVISGYLITSLIMKEILNTGSFSFLHFYRRRIRRLFPALGAMIVTCLLLGIVFYTPQQLSDVAMESIFAVLSVSNVYFWQSSGYFETLAEQRTLLHTWSLSVEEQFYLLWPVSIVCAHRFLGLGGPWLLLLLMFVSSVLINALFASTELHRFDDQYSAMFYLMPFRIHELAIGAMGYWAAKRHGLHGWPVELLAISSLTILVYYFVRGFEATAFPSYHALMPCIAALALILSGKSRVLSTLLANPAMVWVGLISYSLYLVHWPVIVFYKYLTLTSPSSTVLIPLFLLMLILAACSYYLVEKPLRSEPENEPSHRVFFKGFAYTISAVVFVAYLLVATRGLELFKQPIISAQEVSDAMAARDDRAVQPCMNLLKINNGCESERAKPVQIMVIGDSHEVDGFNALNASAALLKDVHVFRFGNTRLCEVLIDDQYGLRSPTIKRSCLQKISALNRDELIASLDVIVLSANQPFAEDKLYIWRVVRAVAVRNPELKLVVLGGFLNTHVACAELINRTGSKTACKNAAYLEFSAEEEIAEVANHKSEFDLEFLYIDKFKLLCEGRILENCEVSLEGFPAFYDQHHLSLEFSEYLGGLIWKKYGDAILDLN